MVLTVKALHLLHLQRSAEVVVHLQKVVIRPGRRAPVEAGVLILQVQAELEQPDKEMRVELLHKDHLAEEEVALAPPVELHQAMLTAAAATEFHLLLQDLLHSTQVVAAALDIIMYREASVAVALDG